MYPISFSFVSKIRRTRLSTAAGFLTFLTIVLAQFSFFTPSCDIHRGSDAASLKSHSALHTSEEDRSNLSNSRVCESTREQIELQQENGRYRFMVIGIFKLEKGNLMSWVNHYIYEGADHFFLVDNNDSANQEESCELELLIQAGVITLVKNSTSHIQGQLHSLSRKFAEHSSWVLNADMDEYMYARPHKVSVRNATILDYLATVPMNISAIVVPWKTFGTSVKAHPLNPVNTLLRRKPLRNGSTPHKWIARGPEIVDAHIHSILSVSPARPCLQATPDFRCVGSKRKTFQTEETMESYPLHLCHYQLQSVEFFSWAKMTRGSASTVVNDEKRTWQYFTNYNSMARDVLDTELRDKRQSWVERDLALKDKLICDKLHTGGMTPEWCQFVIDTGTAKST